MYHVRSYNASVAILLIRFKFSLFNVKYIYFILSPMGVCPWKEYLELNDMRG